jgi:hypothetical protein
LVLCTVLAGFFAVAVPSAAASLVGFHSPSGNIGCFISGQGVRCDIRDRDWTPPPPPASCELDWGQGVAVDRHGRADYVCAGDTALNQGRTLAYGDSISRGRFRCVSKQTKMKCVNERSDHGFKLSTQSAKLF